MKKGSKWKKKKQTKIIIKRALLTAWSCSLYWKQRFSVSVGQQSCGCSYHVRMIHLSSFRKFSPVRYYDSIRLCDFFLSFPLHSSGVLFLLLSSLFYIIPLCVECISLTTMKLKRSEWLTRVYWYERSTLTCYMRIAYCLWLWMKTNLRNLFRFRSAHLFINSMERKKRPPIHTYISIAAAIRGFVCIFQAFKQF